MNITATKITQVTTKMGTTSAINPNKNQCYEKLKINEHVFVSDNIFNTTLKYNVMCSKTT